MKIYSVLDVWTISVPFLYLSVLPGRFTILDATWRLRIHFCPFLAILLFYAFCSFTDLLIDGPAPANKSLGISLKCGFSVVLQNVCWFYL